jgi:hypothetical protein
METLQLEDQSAHPGPAIDGYPSYEVTTPHKTRSVPQVNLVADMRVSSSSASVQPAFFEEKEKRNLRTHKNDSLRTHRDNR